MIETIPKKTKRPYTKHEGVQYGRKKAPKDAQNTVDTRDTLERTLEEIRTMPPHLLHQTELYRLIEQLNDDLLLAQNKNKEYEQGYENLFKENNNLKTAYQNLKIAATQQVTYFKEQIGMLYRTALLIKPLED